MFSVIRSECVEAICFVKTKIKFRGKILCGHKLINTKILAVDKAWGRRFLQSIKMIIVFELVSLSSGCQTIEV